MKRIRKVAMLAAVVCCFAHGKTSGQEAKLKAMAFEGILVGGYADGGGYLNCIGPAIKYQMKSCSMMLGLLPSLRFKKEKVTSSDTPRNAVVTPTLGFGVTVVFRRLALQIPAFYLPKTSTDNGRWEPGIGVGYRF